MLVDRSSGSTAYRGSPISHDSSSPAQLDAGRKNIAQRRGPSIAACVDDEHVARPYGLNSDPLLAGAIFGLKGIEVLACGM